MNYMVMNIYNLNYLTLPPTNGTIPFSIRYLHDFDDFYGLASAIRCTI